jgi:hypothetical protein
VFNLIRSNHPAPSFFVFFFLLHHYSIVEAAMRSRIALTGILCLVSGILFAQKMTVKDSDNHVLMEVNDEGTVGSITIEDSTLAPGTTTNKLYNVGGALHWNGAALGTSGSAGGWTDGDAIVYTTTSTDKVGIGTSSPEFKLSLEDDGGIIAKGSYATGLDLSTSGGGTRLIWYPKKAAFRAGDISGSQWDDTNVGNLSVAMGANTIASGRYSTALGINTTASGNESTAMGNSTIASDNASTAMGFSTTASGFTSTAMGVETIASGNYSTAMGYNTKAESFRSMAIGQYNVGGGNASSWISTDPLFEIGIGADADNRANAVTVLKNGNVGLGIATPGEKLQVNGKTLTSQLQVGTSATAGHVLTADASGNATWQAAGGGGGGGWTAGSAKVYTTTSTDKVGIGTSSPEFKLSLDDDGGILAKGTYGSGNTLATAGAGTRLIWYPKKSAFRAGSVGGTEWDDTNVGYYSVAMGDGTTANGQSSTAMGSQTTASAQYSTAMGLSTTASGLYSTAMNYGTTASGQFSTAMGGETTASGYNSTAMGYNTKAESYGSIALGRYNVGGGTADTWQIEDPLFEIGIGSSGTPANAVTVLKNGNVGIGTATPQGTLDVNGAIYQRGGVLHADYVFEEDYILESIEEHADYMWQNKHLKAIPKMAVDEKGKQIVEVGAHQKGIVEELEKAHIYIQQLYQEIQLLKEQNQNLEKMIVKIK